MTTVTSAIFPNEIIDMFIDELCDDKETLKSCSLVQRCWVPRTRSYLFRGIVIRSSKYKGRSSRTFKHIPDKVKREMLPSTRSIVKQVRFVDNCAFSIHHEPQTIKTGAYVDASLLQRLLILLPNVTSLSLDVPHIGAPGERKTRVVANPEERRRLRYLCLKKIVSLRCDFDLLDIMSLFSGIVTLRLEECYAAPKQRIPDAPLFDVQQLVIHVAVKEKFVRGLFSIPDEDDPKELRLGSVRYLSFPPGHEEEECVDWWTLMNQVGTWIKTLRISLDETLSAHCHSSPESPIPYRRFYWSNMINWDLCEAVTDLTVHCSVTNIPLLQEALMPAMVFLLQDLVGSREACSRSEGPLGLTIEFELDKGYNQRPRMVTFFNNTPWNELKQAFLDLCNHPIIKLQYVAIALKPEGGCEALYPELEEMQVFLENNLADLRQRMDFLDIYVDS